MMRARFFAASMALLCLVAAPASAQDLRFSIDDTEQCLDSAGSSADMESCIGSAAAACMSASDMGSTTVGMSACLDQELAWWDERLNTVYSRLRDIEQAADGAADQPAGAPKRAEALREMQRAWIAYRDAACAYEYAQWGGGTGGGPASVACHMHITGAQAIALEQRLDTY